MVELWFYTPAVGGSIPSAPTRDIAGERGSLILRLTPRCADGESMVAARPGIIGTSCRIALTRGVRRAIMFDGQRTVAAATTRPCTVTVPVSKLTSAQRNPRISEWRSPANVNSQHAATRSSLMCSRNRVACSGVHVEVSRLATLGRATRRATLRATRPRAIASSIAWDRTPSIVTTVRLLTAPAARRPAWRAGGPAHCSAAASPACRRIGHSAALGLAPGDRLSAAWALGRQGCRRSDRRARAAARAGRGAYSFA